MGARTTWERQYIKKIYEKKQDEILDTGTQSGPAPNRTVRNKQKKKFKQSV